MAELTQREKIIKSIAALASDYLSTVDVNDIASLNRRLGYVEALLDIILEQEAV